MMSAAKSISDARNAIKAACGDGADLDARCEHARTGLTWLDAAAMQDPTAGEAEEIFYLTSLGHWLLRDYERAYERFRDWFGDGIDWQLPKQWLFLGALVVLKRAPDQGYSHALREYDATISWLSADVVERNESPLKALLYERKAFCHLRLGQDHDAEACCRIALRLNQESLGALRILAEVSLGRNEPREAIRFLSQSIALRTRGPHFWDYANRGKALLDIGQLLTAREDLNMALALYPGHAAVLNNLGIVIDRSGDESGALRLYGQAMMSDFNWAPAHNNRGVVFHRRREYDVAEAAVNKAVEIEPMNPMLRFNRSVVRFDNRQYGEALRDAEMAIRLGADYWECRYILAMCMAQFRDYSGAMIMLRNLALSEGTRSADVSILWNNLGVMAYKKEDYRTAHECFSVAISSNPINGQAIQNIDRMEAIMSGQDAQGPESETLDIALDFASGRYVEFSQDDLNTALAAASLFISIAAFI